MHFLEQGRAAQEVEKALTPPQSSYGRCKPDWATMMLKYEITDGSLIFTWTDDETLKGYRYRKMSLHSCGETWIINAIAQIILSICNQLSKESLTHYFYAGRQIFEEFKNQSKNLLQVETTGELYTLPL